MYTYLYFLKSRTSYLRQNWMQTCIPKSKYTYEEGNLTVYPNGKMFLDKSTVQVLLYLACW